MPQDTIVPSVKTVVAFGNASLAATVKGKKASPFKLIKKKLKQMQANIVQICFIGEFNKPSVQYL